MKNVEAVITFRRSILSLEFSEILSKLHGMLISEGEGLAGLTRSSLSR